MGRFENALNRRAPRALLARLTAVCLTGAIAASCFVKIADPLSDVEDSSTADTGGVSGASGGSGSGTGGTSAGSGGDAESCAADAGLMRCGSQCVPTGNPDTGCVVASSCNPCNLPHATAGCDPLGCTVDRCEQNWLDCNADPGCETQLEAPANASIPMPLPVPLLDTIVIDGSP